MKKSAIFSCTILILVSILSIAYAKSNLLLMMPPILAASDDKDRIPDPFSFTPVSNAVPGDFVISNPITVSGINDSTIIDIIGGVYSIDGGAFSNAPKTISLGQKVRVGLTAPYNYSTSTTAVLNIGGVSATFRVTTKDDTTPDNFIFVDRTNVPLNTAITSNPITVYGITGPTPITISQGSYSINGAAFTSISGTVTNGQSVRVRLISPNTYSTSKHAKLTIGGVSDTFTVTTIPDTTPDNFSFIDRTNVELDTLIISNIITVRGITAETPISIVGGTYSINGGPFTSVSSTVTNGQNVRVRITSASTYSTTRNATLNIGGVKDTFSVTTKPKPTCEDIAGCYSGNFTDNCPGYNVNGILGVNINFDCTFSTVSIFGVKSSGKIIDRTNNTYIGTGQTDPSGCGAYNITCTDLGSSISCNYNYDNGRSGSISNGYSAQCMPPNKFLTQSLAGSWSFTYQIISTFQDKFYLNKNTVKESPIGSGHFYIYGVDQFNNTVIADYDPTYNNYGLFNPGSIIDQLFIFSYTNTNNIAGCYYQYSHSSGQFSSCYPVNGYRFSSTLSLSAVTENSLEMSTEKNSLLENEVEQLGMYLNNSMIDPSIINRHEAFTRESKEPNN
jgi:hypothetical protein